MVELLIALVILGTLSGLVVVTSNKVLNKTKVNADIATVRSLNSATAMYKTLVNLNSDVFFGLNNNTDRMQALLGSGQISKIPVPNVSESSFRWDVTTQKWVISGYVLTYPADITMGTTTSQRSWILGYKGSYKDIVIPNIINGIAVKEIRASAFASKGLTSVVIEDGIEYIRASAFRYNDLTELVLPNSIVRIDGLAFGNNKLTEIVLPEGLKNIGNQAFLGNYINKITIGAGVTLGTKIFANDNLFRTAYVAGGTGTYILIGKNWVKQ